MDDAPITFREYTDFDEMKADEYRYWQSRPAPQGRQKKAARQRPYRVTPRGGQCILFSPFRQQVWPSTYKCRP